MWAGYALCVHHVRKCVGAAGGSVSQTSNGVQVECLGKGTVNAGTYESQWCWAVLVFGVMLLRCVGCAPLCGAKCFPSAHNTCGRDGCGAA